MNKFNGELLRRKRMGLGLTQIELADKVNIEYGTRVVDAKTISRWEINPNAVPRNNKLYKVATILGCSVENFYEIDNFKLMSINVNQFCGPEEWNEKNISCLIDKYFPIVFPILLEFIKRFLNERLQEIVLIQEVPGIKREDIFEAFNDYLVLEPIYHKNAHTYTIAIANKNAGWEKVERSESIFANNRDYANKIVELKNGKTKVMGVHMNNDVTLWNRVIEVIGKYTIIAGDFNAHYNIHRNSEKREMLDKILNIGYKDLIANDVVTFYPAMTTIDHVFVSEEIDREKSSCEVIPKNYSDHAILIAGIVLDREQSV